MKLSWKRSTLRSRDRSLEVAHRRVDVEIEASMSEIEAWKCHIEAFISRSTRRCRDRSLDVGDRSLEVPHRSVHLEIDALISRSMDRSHAEAIYRRETALKIGVLLSRDANMLA